MTGRWPSRDPLGDEVFLQSRIKEIEKKAEMANTDLEALAKQLDSMLKESKKPLYLFVQNSPISHIDYLGLNRKLVGGIHLEVQIDDWKVVGGKYVNNCRNFARGFYGFGINGFQSKKQDSCCNPDGTKWEP